MKTRLIRSRTGVSKLKAVFVSGASVLVGIVVIVAIFASSAPLGFEAESGSVTGPAKTISDSTASGGSAVQFGQATSSGAFVHPGILVTKAQLDYVKAKVGLSPVPSPWNTSYTRLGTAKSAAGVNYAAQVFGSTTYTAHPAAVLDCGTTPDSCTALQDDADAAYTLALEYYYSAAPDRAKWATASITIMNDWSSTMTCAQACYNGNQSRLVTAFSAGMYAQAAEILRYEYTPATGQPSLNIPNLKNLFTKGFIPNITAGDPFSNGNWELSMSFSMINMGVFMDDHATFNRGLALWRQRVPAYIYLSSDGTQPNPVPGGNYNTKAKLDCYWAGAGTPLSGCSLPANFSYHNGMVQETCRDMSHVGLGMNALTEAAETAYIQGVDLFSEQKERIIAGSEFSAKYDLQAISHFTSGTSSTSSSIDDPAICGGTFVTGGVGWELGWEVAYNHYKYDVSPAVPMALSDGVDYLATFLTTQIRPSSYKAFSLSAWQSLTQPRDP